MLVDEFRFDVNEIEAARSQTRPVFAALILLVEGHCTEVDDLHRALLLEAGLDELALVRTHDALADGFLHLLEACLDFLLVRGGTELPEEVLQHVDRDVEADFQLLDEVLADDSTGKGIKEPSVEIVDRNFVDRMRIYLLIWFAHVQSHSSR